MVFPPRSAKRLFGYSEEQRLHTKFLALDVSGDKTLDESTLDELKAHLQAAIILELKTIPPYLYAAYSIKASGPAKWSILNVVQQEMLHLSLAGNILRAIGGEPKLYSLDPPDTEGENSATFPSYPSKMFYQETPLHLRGATKPNLRTFLDLERPSVLKDQAEDSLDDYESIGTFYWAVGEALKFQSAKSGKKLFHEDSLDKQLQYGDGSWYSDDMVVVKDIESAMRALTIIVDQGEGTQREPMPARRPGSLDPQAPLAIKSHFEIFQDVYQGPPLDHYDVFENPKTKDFETSYPNIYKVESSVLLVGDAAYCYLLQTIETLWKTDDGIKRMHLVNNNLHNIMLNVLRPLTTFLLPKTGKVNPSGEEQHFNLFFNYYAFGTTGTKLMQLKELTKAAVEANPDVKILLEVQEVVGTLEDVEPTRTGSEGNLRGVEESIKKKNDDNA